MNETASLPYFRPLPWLILGAVIGVAMFGMHGIGAIVLTLVGVGFAAKWMYRWQAAHNGTPVAWASCAGPGGRKRDRRMAEPAPSGNMVFDDYRRDMIRRLEQDHMDFQSFLDRLRRAKDKAEFDQFMAERGGSAPPAEHVERPQSPWPNA